DFVHDSGERRAGEDVSLLPEDGESLLPDTEPPFRRLRAPQAAGIHPGQQPGVEDVLHPRQALVVLTLVRGIHSRSPINPWTSRRIALRAGLRSAASSPRSWASPTRRSNGTTATG